MIRHLLSPLKDYFKSSTTREGVNGESSSITREGVNGENSSTTREGVNGEDVSAGSDDTLFSPAVDSA